MGYSKFLQMCLYSCTYSKHICFKKKKKKSDVSNSDRTLSGFRREVGREMVTVIREIREQQVWVATTFVLPG